MASNRSVRFVVKTSGGFRGNDPVEQIDGEIQSTRKLGHIFSSYSHVDAHGDAL